jgi:DNA polymerase-3 subunit epsilon
MSSRVKFALLLAGLYLLSLVPIAVVGAAFWADLDWVERDSFLAIVERRADLFALAALTMLGVVAALLRAFYVRYVTPPLRMAEGTRLILGANPAHRVTPEGGSEPQALAGVINAFAAQHEALKRDVEGRIREAQARVAEERNRLAALVSELTQGVLVCNAEGRILLFNARARDLLGHGEAARPTGGGASLVGLGRSVFAIFDRSLVAHAVETIQGRLRAGASGAVAHFAATAGDHLVHVQVTPVRAPAEGEAGAATLTGMILLVDDVTEVAERESRRAGLFLGFADASRRSLAAIRAAVETLLSFPEMDAARQTRFAAVIDEEATALSSRLERTEADYTSTQRSDWLLQAVAGADLAAAAARHLRTRVDVPVHLGEVDPSLWLRADAYSLLQAISALGAWLRLEGGARELRLELRANGKLAQLDVGWSGASLAPDQLTAWEDRPLAAAGEASPLTARQVVERHEGELWHQVDREAGRGLFRLVLPLATPEVTAALPSAAALPGRPEFFDFDLFAQAELDPELDRRRLADLAYAVFDTETTGLVPGQDELVCIGAVRIVNGRLLHQESFEQFVDPRRPMSEESARITGIDPSMLRGQPRIEEVLPRFHQYCEDDVLVAHNAAFDMRFLQLLEPRTGVRFTQPVLDTMLLCQVLHPTTAVRTFEEMAARFGVPVIGRHTALGDAMMTGEVFAKMIPLLAALGIVTLKDAREASQRTWLARVQY